MQVVVGAMVLPGRVSGERELTAKGAIVLSSREGSEGISGPPINVTSTPQ